MPEKFPVPFCEEMHQYFVDIRGDEFTNTEAPRGFAKTTIKCFLIPLYMALNEPDSFRHYCNTQSTVGKALSINTAIKGTLEKNELMRELYGDQVGKEKWTDKQFVLRNGVIFTAIGTGESVRGLNYDNVRPDYIIVDDLYDDDDLHNIESTQKKTDWFWSTLYYARALDRRCSMHVQGTAINKADLMEQLKSDPKVKSRTFRAVKNFDTREVLWPELMSYDALMDDLRRTGSLKFYRERQNERRDSATAIIKPEWLRFYRGAIPGDVEQTGTILGCDPSIGANADSDYTGTATVLKARVKDGTSTRYYIKSVGQDHLTLDGRIRKLETLHQAEKYTESIIEGIAGFKDFVAEVRRRTNLPVREVDKVKDKITNKVNKSHWFENGHVYINEDIPADLKAELIEQLTNNTPRHDDIADAVLLCIEENDTIQDTREAIKTISQGRNSLAAGGTW